MFPINDEVLESAAEWQDAGFYVDLDDATAEEWDVPEDSEHWRQLVNEDGFWFREVPDLSPEDLAALDYKADNFEVQRLLRMGVIAEMTDSQHGADCKDLTAKFVRTWRPKKKDGVDQVYRRSRLVARDFKWMERDREGLYAPATSSATTKLLPWLFCKLQQSNMSLSDDDRYGILALDIKDAYLTVP